MKRRTGIRPRGLTLVEVVIATVIVMMVAGGAVSAILFSTRVALSAQEDMMALEMVNRQIEMLKSDGDYVQLGLPPGDPLKLPGAIDYWNDVTFDYDPNFPANGPQFTVDHQWYGFGRVTGSTASSITFTATNWPTDVDFTGRYVVIRNGNHIAKITADSGGSGSRTFTIDYALNGWGNSEWGVIPLPGDRFEVDGGKWCRVTISWTSPRNAEPTPENTRTVRREVFVPWRAR